MERLYRERIQQERNRYDQVSRLAGIGMAAELLTDAFSREMIKGMTILQALEGEVRVAGNTQMRDLIAELTARMDIVNEQLDLMGPIYRPSTRENEPVNLRGAVYDVLAILSSQLNDIRTKVIVSGHRYLAVHISRGHLMQVLMILIENAIRMMTEAGTSDPRLDIQMVSDAGSHGLLIADSGPGVPPGIAKLIFAPYYSTRQAGRGLGLHVARDILASYNSSLDLASEPSRLPGACFEIRFDGRRVAAQPEASAHRAFEPGTSPL
jgi:C4-dicarboxylate-specific signal transduction histidine kinase